MSLKEKRFLPGPALLAGSALYLLLNLFASPRVPYLLSGDQVFFWSRAMRMLGGEHIYRDFLQFTQPPGLDILFLSLFKLFGLRIWVTNLVVFVLGFAFVWLVFSIARRFMRTSSALLAAAVFLVPLYGKALTATHHWFAVLAVLAAIRVVLGGLSAPRLAIAGAVLGLGSYFSTYHGVAGLLALSAFVVWSGTRIQPRWAKLSVELLMLLVGYVAALVLLYAHYLISGGTVGELWYFQVTYVRKVSVQAFRGLRALCPVPFDLHSLPALSEYLVVYLLLAVAMVGALYFCWKRRRQYESIAPAVLMTLVAVFLFGEVAISPSWLRIYAVAAPSVILLAWVIEQLPRQRVWVSSVLWGWTILLGVHQTITHHRTQRAVIDLPAGRVAMAKPTADGLRLVEQFAKPGDALFQAAWPGIYLPLHLRNPLSFETVGLDDTRPGDIGLIVQELNDRRVPYVLWAESLDSQCPSPCSDRLTPVREVIHAGYVPVTTLPDGDTLWRRRQ